MKKINIIKYFATIIILLSAYYSYLPLQRHFILPNCDLTAGGLGFAGYTCFGFYNILYEAGIYIYIYILGLLVPLILPNDIFNRFRKMYIICSIVFLILIVFICFSVPYVNIEDIPSSSFPN